MRIVVNDIAASESGALSILLDFYSDINKNDSENEWYFLLNKRYFEDTDNIKVLLFPEIKNSWVKRFLFDIGYGKKIINDLKPDVYFSMQNTATLGVKCRQITYLHQPLPYQNEKKFSFFKKSERKLKVYQSIVGLIFNSLFRMTKSEIVVQTRWMKESVKKKVGNQITIIPPNININSSRVYKPNRSFFYPASYIPYKDHRTIIQANKKLINSGFEEFTIDFTLTKNDFENRSFPKNINLLGKIPREDVYEKYSRSVLLFPSYIETYGMPLKEARISNSIIFASDTEFAREILEGYPNCYFFKKRDSDGLYKLMAKYLSEELEYTNSAEKFDKKNVGQANLLNYVLKKNET